MSASSDGTASSTPPSSDGNGEPPPPAASTSASALSSGAPAYITDAATPPAPVEQTAQTASTAPTPVLATTGRANLPHQCLPLAALSALGVVFGDLGTSPLYALATVFSIDGHAVRPDPLDIFGVISIVFWSVMLVVSIKYAMLIMRADNEGEGGILALVALLRGKLHGRGRLVAASTVMGIIGAALFYGDAMITPAISVMSAIEGVSVVHEGAEAFVVPVSILVLAALFAVQRRGTARIGRFFGPIMALWFSCIAILGIPHIISNPVILGALSPHHALRFGIERPGVAFIAIGATVLCITGAEALYADMGHFGKRPIQVAWFYMVLPALMLNYLGQGAMLLAEPSTSTSPFFQLAPRWAVIPLVILATAATVIASQSVISGVFSVSRQATRLGLLPRLHVRYTSEQEGGQIYINSINWLLFAGVVVLVIAFQSSINLATAFGLAVTGTLLLTLVVFLFLARQVWGWALWKIIAAVVVFGGLELVYLVANLAKIVSGGWLPLLVATVIVAMMTTWQMGSRVRARIRKRLEGPLDEFIGTVHAQTIPRVDGVAIYPHPNSETVPLALKENLLFNKVLHKTILIITIINENIPHVRHSDRLAVSNLRFEDDGIFHINYHVGFNDSQDIPRALRLAQKLEKIDHFEPTDARYFLSVLRLGRRSQPLMPRWRRELFLALSAAEANRTAVFHLPVNRTIILGAQDEV